ncbi:MAG: OmpH family outer membrane protein [Bacteroidales bacterium]|nr:OmpH family outer membrane protein [Bacteroidales bacterium]MDD4683884.1 OmpH family outer membrane protein [Bacteroidales bacterium]
MDNQDLDNNNIEDNINSKIASEEEKIEEEKIIYEEPKDTIPLPKGKKRSPLIITFAIFSILSFVGVIVLLCLFLCGGPKENNISSTPKVVQTGDLRIAYVNTDSILTQYEYAKDLEKSLTTYQTSLEANYQAQGKKLQTDYENYLKTGDKLTLTEQKKKEEDLTRRQQEFPMLQQKMMAQLQQRQFEDNKKLLNAVYAFINDYNAKNQKFNIILSRSYISSAVLYADDALDITDEIVKGLNQEYKNVKGK